MKIYQPKINKQKLIESCKKSGLSEGEQLEAYEHLINQKYSEAFFWEEQLNYYQFSNNKVTKKEEDNIREMIGQRIRDFIKFSAERDYLKNILNEKENKND